MKRCSHQMRMAAWCSVRTGAASRTAQAFAPNVKLVAVGSRKNLCIHAQLRRIKSAAVRAPRSADGSAWFG